MDMLIGISGFLGCIICIILTIVSAFKKNGKAKKFGIGILVTFIMFCVGVSMSPAETNKVDKTVATKTISKDTKKENIEVKKAVKKENTNIETVAVNTSKTEIKGEQKNGIKVDYDKLQQLYLDIDNRMTYEEVLKSVVKTGLPYTDGVYNGSRNIKVALEAAVAEQSYAKSGDEVSISFNEVKKNNGTAYEFGDIEYFNNSKFVKAFQYVSGTYWDFRESSNQGYYIDDYDSSRKGFEISYSNGNKVTTHYLVMDSKEKQLQYIFNLKK